MEIHFNHHDPKATHVTKPNIMERSVVLQGRCHRRSILSLSELSQPNYGLPPEALSWHWFVDQNSLKISIPHITKLLGNFCIQVVVFCWLEKGMTIHPLQCSCLENSMDRGALWATVHGATKSQTHLRSWHFTFIPLKQSNSDLLRSRFSKFPWTTNTSNKQKLWQLDI